MSKHTWGSFKTTPPVVLGINLFILISPFIDWHLFNQETTQKLYFVFGIVVLYLLSLLSKPKRQLTDWRIGLFVLWSLFLMFWHSKIWVNSFTFRYLNFYLMSEGFIHVFFAVLFYRLVYEYMDKIPALYFAFIIYLGRGIFIQSLSPIFTVAICCLIYALVRRQWWIVGLIALWVVLYFWGEHTYIMRKWQARAFGWPYTIKEIIQHPYVGTGFDKSIMMNMIPGPNGWCFRHNDFLNIVKDLGLPALVFIGIFLKGFIRKFRADLLSIICLGTLIVSFFQTSWYWPRLACIFIPCWALWSIKYGKKDNSRDLRFLS